MSFERLDTLKIQDQSTKDLHDIIKSTDEHFYSY